MIQNNRDKVAKNFRGYEFFVSGEDLTEAPISKELIELLQTFRHAWGRSVKITSGYRSPEHKIEKAKKTPGQHALGLAVDIEIVGGGHLFYTAVKCAIECGFTGIGINRHKEFLHLDVRKGASVLWTYDS